jgi:hypothetical protein
MPRISTPGSATATILSPAIRTSFRPSAGLRAGREIVVRRHPVGDHLDVLPDAAGDVGVGREPVVELGPGRELGDRGRADHVAIIVDQCTADQEMSFGLQPGRILEMCRARREPALRRLLVLAVHGDDQPLHPPLPRWPRSART